ncbi:MAG TPA: response regulator transcription factor [Thermodesulfovibrionales bacterium]|nr:response regulator transcription factor [Thermodesulfovibrionales bacterium]
MPISVFIADDHAVVREGLRLLLEAQTDIKVIGNAADGRQTVLQVQQLCPDVVVMDIAMPELNGIEATRKLTEFCPSTQVVILSMYATAEHIFRALQAGALGYLLKESAAIEVVNAVRAVHSGRRYICKKIDEIMIDTYIHKRQVSGAKSPLESLSPREREILQLVVEGKSSAEISIILTLSQKTVETYRSRLMQKLGIKDIPGLVKFAILHGMTSPE